MDDFVGHAEQIKEILKALTTYEGEFYPKAQNLAGVNESRPKFLVIPSFEPFTGDPHQSSEHFKVQVEADSLENLESAIADIQAASTGSSSGWIPGTTMQTDSLTMTVGVYTDDISRDEDDEAGSVLDGVYGKMKEVPE